MGHSVRESSVLDISILSETSFDKITTYQGRGNWDQKNSKEDEDVSKIIKQKHRIVPGGSSSEY